MKQMYMLLVLSISLQPGIAGALSPNETIQQATGEILKDLVVHRERLQKDPDYIRTISRQVLAPHFDFVTMTHLILGSYWDDFTWAERACIVKGFRNRLIQRYSHILLSYDNHQITYLPPKEINYVDYVVVKQKLTNREGISQIIGYPLRRDGEKNWKVVDLIVEDVSMLKNYRNEYTRIITKDGKQGLLRYFSECEEFITVNN